MFQHSKRNFVSIRPCSIYHTHQLKDKIIERRLAEREENILVIKRGPGVIPFINSCFIVTNKN